MSVGRAWFVASAIAALCVVAAVRWRRPAAPVDHHDASKGVEVPLARVEAPTSAPAIVRTEFTELPDAGSDHDAAATPIPPHLRKVAVQVVYDDGHPLAGALAFAAPPPEIDDEPPSQSGSPVEDPWDPDRGARLEAKLDAEGRAVFRVPIGARFVVSGLGEDVPTFVTEPVAASVAAARLVVPANALRLRIVDESGAPCGNRRFSFFEANVLSTRHTIKTSDDHGEIVCRGLAPGLVQVSHDDEAFPPSIEDVVGCGISFTPDLPSNPPDRCEAAALARVEGPDGPCALDCLDGVSFQARVPSDLRVVMRRMPTVALRVVDPTGRPVRGAKVALSITIERGPHPVAIKEEETPENGRVRLPLPRDGRTIALDAKITSARFEVVGPDGSGPFVVERPGPADAGLIDMGDVVVPASERLSFRFADEFDSPVHGATIFALGADEAVDTPRSSSPSNDAGIAEFFARPGDQRLLVRCGHYVDATIARQGKADELPGAVRRVVLQREATIEFVVPESEKYKREVSVSAVRTSGAADQLFRVYFGGEDLQRYAVPPGIELLISFSSFMSSGDAATDVPVAPLLFGETRRVVVPPPPARARLRISVVAADGSPAAECEVTAHGPDGRSTGDHTGSGGIAVFDGWATGLSTLDIQGDVDSPREAVVTGPVTDFLVRLRRGREAVLRINSAVDKSARSHVVEAANSTGKRLQVNVREDLGEELAVPRRRIAYVAVATPDETIVFSVERAGKAYEVAAPPGIERVELNLSAEGTLAVRAPAVPVKTEYVWHAVPDGSESHTASDTRFAPPARAPFEFEEQPLCVGRYRVELYVRVPGPHGYGCNDSLVGTKLVDVTAGRLVIADFSE